MSAVRFGVVSDEISNNVHRSLQLASEWGMEYIELNSVWNKSITDITDEEAERVLNEANQFGLRVHIVLISFLKPILIHELNKSGELDDLPEFKKHMAMLDRGLELAQAFGTNLVRTFSFRRPEGDPYPIRDGGGEIPERVMEIIRYGMRQACDKAKSRGCLLALENVRSCYGNSGENAAAIMNEVGDDLKAIWDPANALIAGGEVYPKGYELVRDRIVDVHLKDAVIEDREAKQTRWECIGKGETPYKEQFAALLEDGLTESWTLETHFRSGGIDGEEASRQSFAGMKSILESVQ